MFQSNLTSSADYQVPDTKNVGQAGWSYDIDRLSPQEFDALAAGFSDACYDQLASYKALAGGGKQYRFVCYQNGEAKGGCLVVVYQLPGTRLGIANVRFGPFWRQNGGPIDPAIYRNIINQLTEEFCKRRKLMLTLFPKAHPDNQQVEQSYLEAAGFKKRDGQNSKADRYFVDLTASDDAQLHSLNQKWRYNLRRSLKEDVSIRLARDTNDFRVFEDIHQAMVSRKSVSLSDKPDIVETLHGVMEESFRPQLFIATLNGQPAAGIVVARAGDVAYYLYGATTSEALKARLGYRLQWHIIQKLSEQGFRLYDLGGASGAAGLRQFKEGLIGKRGWKIDMAPEYDLATSWQARFGGSLVHALRDVKGRSLEYLNR